MALDALQGVLVRGERLIDKLKLFLPFDHSRARIELNGVELQGVQAVDFTAALGEPNHVRIELVAEIEVETTATVEFEPPLFPAPPPIARALEIEAATLAANRKGLRALAPLREVP